jgi:hypothetical protein
MYKGCIYIFLSTNIDKHLLLIVYITTELSKCCFMYTLTNDFSSSNQFSNYGVSAKG